VLALAMPRTIECPGYTPHSDNGIECKKVITAYRATKQRSNRPVEVRYVTPEYINGLERDGPRESDRQLSLARPDRDEHG